ncbi:epoxyqueuosine reductase QueH [Kiritimatiella glycovorans]|uniref:Epoxyqueuosine reductase QueH n=1 Tax=Kiritimatiella glycovorans TaxID=1307763 RepID=A0A0G3EIL4_9BACT|nr:epoxyqueuosine reductase QueH [Kiritimatiella glycovorans]AKJ64655.1 hypothetical protein L21SP4_01408 [Kiritimatiella glycovorans]
MESADAAKRSPMLLHVCCAPCACVPVERLRADGYEPVFFFANSNIWPRPEYHHRRDEAHRLAGIVRARWEEDAYHHLSWQRAVEGLEDEPEGGGRCARCFAFNLERCARKAEELGISSFTTTLTVSPHKYAPLIFDIGSRFEGFVPYDFKKRDGYRLSVERSRELGLYRQNYCGCEFSIP